MSDAGIADALASVAAEMRRSEQRVLPTDPLRRAALVAEEAGEALQAALDLTRRRNPDEVEDGLRAKLYGELVQTAAMTIRVLAAMKVEGA